MNGTFLSLMLQVMCYGVLIVRSIKPSFQPNIKYLVTGWETEPKHYLELSKAGKYANVAGTRAQPVRTTW